MDELNKANEIELVPFIHQVGGHSFMLSLDENTVCKSLIPRELQFYQIIPKGLERFAPTFYGVVRVRTVLGSDGFIHFFTNPPPDFQAHAAAKPKVRFKKSGSIELLTSDSIFLEDGTQTARACLNPWVLKCHQQHIDGWKHFTWETKESNLLESKQKEMTNKCLNFNLLEEKEFIVLENLVSKFKYPCILDLKMGTRQYGDSATLAKKQSKMVKVVSTTSAKLGLRLGGMQVFQKNTNKFLCRNKFYGRSLSVSGFQQALVHFLHNGSRFRTDVLFVLIRRLEELASVLNKLEAFRFYTSSLLILYEGNDHELDASDRCDRRLDKENNGGFEGRRGSESNLSRKASIETNLPFNDVSENLAGCSKRRTSSVANLESGAVSVSSSNSSSTSNIFEESNNQKKYQKKDFRERILSSKSDPGGGVSNSCSEPQVDVRLIDFAHSTNKEMDNLVVYSGPDKGFMFGLETLINMLKCIQCDYG